MALEPRDDAVVAAAGALGPAQGAQPLAGRLLVVHRRRREDQSGRIGLHVAAAARQRLVGRRRRAVLFHGAGGGQCARQLSTSRRSLARRRSQWRRLFPLSGRPSRTRSRCNISTSSSILLSPRKTSRNCMPIRWAPKGKSVFSINPIPNCTHRIKKTTSSDRMQRLRTKSFRRPVKETKKQ